jgi:hypothetical protein
MNKYLSIEEQQAFWTELFAVTIRYEQRRGGAIVGCLDLVSAEEGFAHRFIDHLHTLSVPFVSPAINHPPPSEAAPQTGEV